MSSMVAYPTAIHNKESAKLQLQTEEFNGIVPNKEVKQVKTFDDGIDDESGWFHWVRWRPVSEKALRESEKAILSSTLSTAYSTYFVNIGPVVGEEDCRIWTVSLNTESTEIPLVLLHGFAAGVGFWCLNLDSLAASRPVYAFDLLGFGRSSRPKFSSDPVEAEREFVESIEAWRLAMKISKFVILGHSLGGFLSASFAIRYPDVVESLILADPWGFKDRPLVLQRKDGKEVSIFTRFLIRILEPMNPLSGIRFFGPWGPNLVRRIRSDIIARFEPHVKDANLFVGNYIYQCNGKDPSGETAFHAMMSSFFWAKNPMHRRLHLLHEKLPTTLIFGKRSWVEEIPAANFIERRGCEEEFVRSHVIDATHHVYADRKDEFNDIVRAACKNLKSQQS